MTLQGISRPHILMAITSYNYSRAALARIQDFCIYANGAYETPRRNYRSHKMTDL